MQRSEGRHPARGVGQTLVLLAALSAALLFLLSSADAWGQPTGQSVDPKGTPYVAGELLVTYETGVSTASEHTPARIEGQVEEEIPELDAQLVTFPEVQKEPSGERREEALEQKKQELEQDPAVKTVDYNYIREGSAVPNDPAFNLQYGLTKIQAPQAWDTVSGDGVDVAVVDTGIDTDHPDLQAKIKAQRNFVGRTESPSAEDDNGHGTHVAGIAAASTNNAEGVAGACPGCGLLIAKSLNASNAGTDVDIVEGINWAVQNGAEVINLSLGAPAKSTILETAVNDAWNSGVVVVAAAGNDGNSTVNYPAGYPRVIAVGATDRNDARASYSNFGRFVDVVAPGGSGNEPPEDNILSTYPNDDYAYSAGTSMASPHVAGLAGLLAAQGRPASKVRTRIENTAVDLGAPGRDALFGEGRINAAAAVRIRVQQPNTPPTISNVAPRPGSKIKDRTPRLAATVRDTRTDLRKSDISLSVNGRSVRSFEYDVASDRLSYSPGAELSAGRHTVKVVARDDQGATATEKWRFKIKNVRAGGGGGSPLNTSHPDWPFNIVPEGYPFDIVR